MRKLIVFNQLSLDGFFADINGGIAWAHKEKQDAEWNAFVAENASAGGLLVFGRITYELMASYWPTPAAANDPVVAERMNNLPKVVFSRTMADASWNNTRLLKGGLVAEIRSMKQAPGKHIAILGSASLVAPLAQAGLIDEYQLVVNPVVLGQGRKLFAAIADQLALNLTRTRVFANGNVLLCYEPLP